MRLQKKKNAKATSICDKTLFWTFAVSFCISDALLDQNDHTAFPKYDAARVIMPPEVVAEAWSSAEKKHVRSNNLKHNELLSQPV